MPSGLVGVLPGPQFVGALGSPPEYRRPLLTFTSSTLPSSVSGTSSIILEDPVSTGQAHDDRC